MPCSMPLLMPFYPSWEKCTPELLPTPSLCNGVTADKLITLAGSICEMEKELHLLHRPHSNRSVNLGYYFLPPVQSPAYQMVFLNTHRTKAPPIEILFYSIHFSTYSFPCAQSSVLVLHGISAASLFHSEALFFLNM